LSSSSITVFVAAEVNYSEHDIELKSQARLDKAAMYQYSK